MYPGCLLKWDGRSGNISVQSLQFQGEADMVHANTSQKYKVVDGDLAEPPLCGSEGKFCPHHEHYPGTCFCRAEWISHTQVNTKSSQMVGFAPAVSKATDRSIAFLYFAMFLVTSSSYLYVSTVSLKRNSSLI